MQNIDIGVYFGMPSSNLASFLCQLCSSLGFWPYFSQHTQWFLPVFRKLGSFWVKLGRQIFRNIRPWPNANQNTTIDYISTIALKLTPKHPKAYIAVYFLLQILLHYLFTFSVTNFSDLVNFKIRDETKLNMIWDLILTVAAK